MLYTHWWIRRENPILLHFHFALQRVHILCCLLPVVDCYNHSVISFILRTCVALCHYNCGCLHRWIMHCSTHMCNLMLFPTLMNLCCPKHWDSAASVIAQEYVCIIVLTPLHSVFIYSCTCVLVWNKAVYTRITFHMYLWSSLGVILNCCMHLDILYEMRLMYMHACSLRPILQRTYGCHKAGHCNTRRLTDALLMNTEESIINYVRILTNYSGLYW